MKNFFRTFGIFFFGFFMGITILIVAVVYLGITLSKNETNIKNGSYLSIDFSGEISEKPLPDDDFFSERSKLELYEIIRSIESAKFDDKINGILINGDLISFSTVHNTEIMYELEEFKKTGKKIYSWFSSGNNSNYFLSSVSDKIYMPDTDSSELSLTGYSLSLPYYKKLFDNVGVSFEVIHTGKYKGTGENYTNLNMSDEVKRQYSSVFDTLYNLKINEIAKNRKIDVLKLKELYTEGKTVFLTSNDALKLKLIDGLKTYDETLSEIFGNNEKNIVSLYDYAKSVKPKMTGDKIAVIYAEGSISNYYSGNDFYSGNVIGAITFNNQINKIINDNSIKGVIIRVNSPGGSALASELMYQEIKKLKTKKKVYVSMGSYAASGGYYISIPADKIIASPYTVTGSIGVVSMFFNIKMLNEKIGINNEILKKNKYDDIFNINRKPDADEINLIRKSSLNIYNEFTGHLENDRKIKQEEIANIAEGRIWSGEQALKIGLVDELGSFSKAVNIMKKDLLLNEVILEEYPKPESFFDRIKNGVGVKSDFTYSMIKENKHIISILEAYFLYNENSVKPLTYLPFTKAID